MYSMKQEKVLRLLTLIDTTACVKKRWRAMCPSGKPRCEKLPGKFRVKATKFLRPQHGSYI